MDLLSSFLGTSGYLPHGYCFTWTPGLLWAMVGADGVIAAAYFSIPLAILTFNRRRADGAASATTRWVPWLFSAFIFACGITHVMDIWTIWQPDYGLQALTKTVTAMISIATAIALWLLIPKALKIPSVARLQSVIASLEAEIGKRRSAEDHLAEAQQSLAATLATIGAGFVAMDSEGRVTRMNGVAERVTGWLQSEAQGQSIWAVFAREDRPADYASKNPITVMIEQGIDADTSFQMVAVARDGTRTQVEVKAALTRAADGTPNGVAMVLRDMTDAMRAAAESSRLAALVESSYDAIIGKTLDGCITSWNHAAESMFGYSAEEAIGQPVQMLIPPDRLDEEMRILAELSHGARVAAFDTVRRTRDGALLDVSVTISPIRDARGRIVGASKIARDVSQQRRAEAAQRDSEERLRFTLDSARIGAWEIDLTTGLVRRSHHHDRCFGYEQAVTEWSFDIFVQHVHPDDRDAVVGTLYQAMTDLSDATFECRVVWPDASVHWISVHCDIAHANGKPTRLLGIVSDITDQKLAEAARLNAERLEAENRQIQASNRMKSQFLANMSHELRTPLNAIIGFADLLHAGAVPVDSPKHRQFLGHIGTSGRHLLQLINDVLDLSKVESGKFEFFPEPVELAGLFKEVRDILHTATLRKHIRIDEDIAPELTGLVLDPGRLKQVLYNYLSNAIKFTPEGGHVTLRARPEGERRFRIEVEDNGVGIAEANLPRLFTEFQQLDAGYSKQYEGTGLGLALTRRLVEAQGGSVGVSSRLGKGSVFYLVLDRVLAIEAQADEAPARVAEPATNRCLVISDRSDRQARLVEGLAGAGFEVDAAPTGAQALQCAQSQAYDAIALDLALPDQRGLGVLADIRRFGPSRESPVVGVTVPIDTEQAASFSIADLLSKPIRTEEVAAAMARFRLTRPRSAKVMVVDDDPAALALMRTTLEGIGIEALCVPGGREALQSIDRLRPDAIILDLMMPELDGFAVLEALRGLPAWREVPVFIWTSMILTDAEYASLAGSARAILGKGGGGLAGMLENLRHWHAPAGVTSGGSGT